MIFFRNGKKIVFPNLLLITNLCIFSHSNILVLGCSLSPIIMTDTTYHHLGIIPPWQQVVLFIQCSIYKANCSCRLWFDIAVRFRADILFLSLLSLCGLLTEIVLNPWRWQIQQANILLACWLGRIDMYKQIQHGEAGRYCIKTQACPSVFTSVSAILL